MTSRKGILLAGGYSTRLYPMTLAVPKSLLPIYDKPLIYYPLSVLMLADIREIAVITTPDHQASFRKLLGDGSAWGLGFEYLPQDRPRGLAHALILAEQFLAGSSSMLVLGDNIHYGGGLVSSLRLASGRARGASVFAYAVAAPERFGVVSFTKTGRVESLTEKPSRPRSNYAVTGLYCYDQQAPKLAAQLKPSGRGELEITDLNLMYLKRKKLAVDILGRGVAWFDTGTPDSLAEATEYVRVVQKRQGLMIACLEEIAWSKGWLSKKDINATASRLKNTSYANYLRMLVKRA